jgi:enoyl-CoA hydratase/carnithine racemase
MVPFVVVYNHKNILKIIFQAKYFYLIVFCYNMDYYNDKRIGWIYIDNPGKKNALNLNVLNSIYKSIKDFSANRETRVIILTGKGENFSSGADIDMLANFKHDDAVNFRNKMEEIITIMKTSKKPVIALYKGYALGGGLELSLSADIRIASSSAILGFPESFIGLNGGAGSNSILPKITGKGYAFYLAMTGRKISAMEAQKARIVDIVLDDSNFDHEVDGILNDIISKPSITIEKIKDSIIRGFDEPEIGSLRIEAENFISLFSDPSIINILKKWSINK